MMKSPLIRLLGFVTPFKGLVALAVLLGVATIGSGVALMGVSAYLISAAALMPSIAALQVAIVGVRFFGISRGVFRYLERLATHSVTFRVLARLRVWFYRALKPLAPARLMGYRSGDLLSRVVSDVDALENFFARAIAPPLVALMAGLAAAAFLWGYSPPLGLALLAFLLLAGLGVPSLTLSLTRHPGHRLPGLRARLGAALVEGIQGMGDLLEFGRDEDAMKGVRKLGAELSGLQKRMAWISGLGSGLNALLTNLGMWVLLVLGIGLVSSGALDGLLLATVALLTLASFEAVQPLTQAAQYLESSLEAGRRLFEIVDAEPEACEPLAPLPRPASFDLRVKNLEFRYVPDEAFSLHDVSFELPPGGRVAIVGPSGAGKTSLVNLLLRFWEYQAGHITLGGREIREYSLQDLRRTFAVVPQGPHLFNATLRDNLRIARPDATQAEMEKALGSAQLCEFLQSQPEGYETWIGEAGLRLSGGERQRLAIARAILQDAPILILDEPTANLDTLTEQKVLQATLERSEGKSILLITHRLVGLEAMDEILVLTAGRIVERGRQDELLARKGAFYQMWQLQNQRLD